MLTNTNDFDAVTTNSSTDVEQSVPQSTSQNTEYKLHNYFSIIQFSERCPQYTRKDSTETAKVVRDTGAKDDAAIVTKRLFCSDTAQKYLSKIKEVNKKAKELAANTGVPFAFKGQQLIPNTEIINVEQQFAALQSEYFEAVAALVAAYSIIRAEAAVDLGSMFDAVKFPSESRVRGDFAFDYKILPIAPDNPLSECETENQRIVAQSQKRMMQQVIDDNSARVRKYIKAELDRIIDQFTPHKDDKAKQKKISQSLLTNSRAHCETIQKFSVLFEQDPEIFKLQASVLTLLDKMEKYAGTKVDKKTGELTLDGLKGEDGLGARNVLKIEATKIRDAFSF
jgi:hypothetical protein